MATSSIVQKTIAFVKTTLISAEGGHDWFHTERVYKNALLIAKHETVDLLVVQLGALLHDIADSKFHNGNETIGPAKAKTFLTQLDLPSKTVIHIVKIIENVSFKGGNFSTKFNSKELEVIQDADRLDAIGAIGIARTFNYGGFKNRALYHPDIPPKLNMTKEEYKNSTAPTINHFYEKLLLLSNKMHTQSAKTIAAQRHTFMEQFLEQFYAEWEGLR